MNSIPVLQNHPAADRCREKLFRLRRELRIPRAGQRALETDEHLCTCIRHLQEAGAKGDIQTYEKALDALEYGLCRAANIGKAAEEIWQIKDKIITLSEYVWLFSEQIKKDDEQIAEFIEEKERIQWEIREQEGKGKRVFADTFHAFAKPVSQKVTGDRLSLSSQMQMAISLNEEIENHKKQRAINQQTKNG